MAYMVNTRYSEYCTSKIPFSFFLLSSPGRPLICDTFYCLSLLSDGIKSVYYHAKLLGKKNSLEKYALIS